MAQKTNASNYPARTNTNGEVVYDGGITGAIIADITDLYAGAGSSGPLVVAATALMDSSLTSPFAVTTLKNDISATIAVTRLSLGYYKISLGVQSYTPNQIIWSVTPIGPEESLVNTVVPRIFGGGGSELYITIENFSDGTLADIYDEFNNGLPFKFEIYV